MSMHPNHYVMLAAPVPIDQFSPSLWDDEWLPYTEGHDGVELSIVHGESDVAYVGKVYGERIDDQREDGHQEIGSPTPDDTAKVIGLLRKVGSTEQPRLMVVTVWR